MKDKEIPLFSTVNTYQIVQHDIQPNLFVGFPNSCAIRTLASFDVTAR